MKQILVVEDDKIIASGLIYALEQEGYAASHCANIADTLTILTTHKFDLCLLDMQLPDGTGFDLRKKLRGAPIIILTVVDDESSIVHAFEGGAEDYVTKPFRLRELLARVNRTLNASANETNTTINIGDIVIDVSAGKMYKNGALVSLTALEYRLLHIFATHRGQLLTRTQLLTIIWDSAGSFVEDNTLTVYVKRLREKLGNALKLETVRGVGYRVD